MGAKSDTVGPSGSPGGQPRVSVVMPVWNGERFLHESLDSVFAQSFSDFEVITVDDGSTDGSRAVIERYGDRIRYVWQPNAGQSSARNHGARVARGEFVALLDQDDRWEPQYLERTVSYLDAHPEVGLIAPCLRFLTPDGRPTPRVLRKRSPGDVYTTRSLIAGDVGTIHTPLMRRELFQRSGGFDTTIKGPEDCALWFEISFLSEMRHLPEPLLLYRVHEGNFSKNYLDNARQWLLLLKKFESRHPEFCREHSKLMRRNWAKQYRRLGRELVARADESRDHVREARRALGRSIRNDPRKPKSYLYFVLSYIPGLAPLFARWRRRELQWRQRLLKSELLGRLSELRRGAKRNARTD